MFENVGLDSTIISIVDVKLDGETKEESSACTLTVRVLNESKWKKMIQDMLLLTVAEDTEEVGMVVKQEFYMNADGKPSFVWIVYVWGDLDEAESLLTPILNKRGGPPAPPPSLGISAPVFSKKPPVRKATVKQDGSVVKEVRLPHKRNQATDTDTVINVRDPNAKKTGRAFVTGYNGS